VLEIIDLCAAYGETGVLHGISLTADPGQITAIIGANGAGKSTMLKCVTGLLKPSRGRILWEGRDLSKVSTAGIVSLGVTMVPEGRHIFPQMTVAENLDMGAYLRHDRTASKRSCVGNRAFPEPAQQASPAGWNSVWWGATDAGGGEGSHVCLEAASHG